jgi:enoyl-CoA hydratase/carnithine racemase
LGGVYRSAERVGPLLAYEWSLTSEEVPAEVMHRHGGVNRVVEDADLLPEALAFAEKLAHGATLAHAAHKVLVRTWAIGGVAAADDVVADVYLPLLKSDDWKNGLKNGIAAYRAGKPRPLIDFEGR